LLMFKHLKKFSTILVTGPQRSGTRICAKMIAKDTGHLYIDELKIHIDSLYLLASWQKKKEAIVVQCPSLSRYIHLIANKPEIAVVWMLREMNDIYASQKRIGWAGEAIERMRYEEYSKDLPIARIKLDYWRKVQKPKIKNAFEVEYESLSSHRLWLDKEERVNFRSNQTKRDSNGEIVIFRG